MPPTATPSPETQHPPDICVLLRAHAEQRWLVSKVIPALRRLERPGTVCAEADAGAALAYLEVLWLEAGLRAAATDAAASRLRGPGTSPSVLSHDADRYLTGVRRLRRSVDGRVRKLSLGGGRGADLGGAAT